MRFHALTDNTGNLDMWGAPNNYPYGAPPVLEDNVMDYGEPTWDDVPDKFMNFEDDACKCFSCGAGSRLRTVINHHEEYKGAGVRPARREE